MQLFNLPSLSRLLTKKADREEATIEKDAPTPWEAFLESTKPKQKTIDEIAHDIETVRIPQLRHLCRKTPSIVNAMAVLKEMVFKNRFEWVPNFKSRCPVCGAEFDKLMDTCPECKTPTVEPDVTQKNRADEFFKNINEFNQSLIEVLGIAEDEINMVDHAFLWLEKEYTFIPALIHPGNYDLSDAKLVAIEEVPPEYMSHNLNKETHRHKEEYFCYRHRDVVHELPGYCPKCHCELVCAWYKYKDESKIMYYARDEFIDWTFYDSRSHPPIYSILKKVLVEWGMDNELYERFWNKQLPKDIIAVTTSNLASLDKTKAEIIRQAKNHEIPFIGIQSETGRGTIQKIPLLDDSISDLTNISTRDQIKKDINTVYGVVPLYAADVERSSALSGEGQQLLVQEDRAKAKQATYNEMILPNIMRAMNITDWLLQLKPPTEESELRKLQVKAQEIQNARAMLDMGFTVELDDDGNFTFSGEASRPDITAPSPFASSISKSQYSRSKCMKCSKPPEYEILWAEGIGHAWFCKKHLKEWATAGDGKGEIISVKEIKNGEASKNFSENHNPNIWPNLLKTLQKDAEDWVLSEDDGLIVKARWEEVQEALRQGSLWESYVGLSGNEIDTLNGLLAEEFQKTNVSLNRITERITETLGLPEARARLIGQTEMAAVLNKARELDYAERDPAGEFRYKALNPVDHRTTKCCERIVKRTERGVPMDELKKIFKEESERFAAETNSNFRYTRDFVPHYGCRTSYVRVVR